MKRRIIALFVVIGLLASVRTSFADLPDGGYAWPTFRDLAQTFILMKGMDITKPRVADMYAHIIYCKRYEENSKNDFVWRKMRAKIISRAIKKQEYFRVRYQEVTSFKLGHYDFKKQYFPIVSKQAFKNVGYISLYNVGSDVRTSCTRGTNRLYTSNIVLELDTPLTIEKLNVPRKLASILMVRLQEQGDEDRKVYARIRMVVTGAKKGVRFSQTNIAQFVLTGHVASVDFFLDKGLTEPIGSIKLNN